MVLVPFSLKNCYLSKPFCFCWRKNSPFSKKIVHKCILYKENSYINNIGIIDKSGNAITYIPIYLSHTEFHCAYLRIRRVVKKKILARFPRLSGGAQAGLSEPGTGGEGHCALKLGFTRTFRGNQGATLK